MPILSCGSDPPGRVSEEDSKSGQFATTGVPQLEHLDRLVIIRDGVVQMVLHRRKEDSPQLRDFRVDHPLAGARKGHQSEKGALDFL